MNDHRHRNRHGRALASVALLAWLAAPAAPATAQYTGRDRMQLEQAHREEDALAPQQAQRRMERARQNCAANRGVDCDSPAGLREWLLLERGRAEAVLDIVFPLGSPSAGASRPAP